MSCQLTPPDARSTFNSRRQLAYCLTNRLVEVIKILPVRSTIERLTDVRTAQPEVDIILLIGHRFLVEGEPKILVARDTDVL